MTSADGIVGWPADIAARYAAEGWWQGLPLSAHLRAAEAARPDAPAVVDGDVRFTYAELAARVDGAATRLGGLGLRSGDRIVVQLPNCWEFLVLVLACFRLGVAPVMALPAHRRHEIAHLVAESGATTVAVGGATDFDHQAMAREVLGPGGTVLVADGRAGDGSVCLRATCAPAADPRTAATALDRAAPGSRSVALFLLSGGTTGMPKLIARTHDDYACAITAAARVCELDSSTGYLAVLPMGHNFTLGGPGVLGTLFTGGHVVIARSAAPERVLPLVAREGVTVTGLVPAVAQRWMDYQEVADPRPDLSSLQLLQVGGSRMPDTEAARVRPVLGAVVQQGYGMAEGLICFNRPDDPPALTHHTQGRPIHPGDELRVVDPETGAAVEPGAPGLLLTRGPYTVRGYYDAPDHDARAFTPDGFYRTGDIVELRADGNVVVVGRDKDMINRAGEKVSAEEVENVVLGLDVVARAAAVSMPDPALGERVCLYVVPRAGAAVELADVVAAMDRAGVARFKHPERLVTVEALPVTPIGKTDKKALRSDIAARLAAEAVGSAGPTADPAAGRAA